MGHRLRLGRAGAGYRAGRSAFVEGPFGDSLVAGERSPRSTRIHVIDLSGRCVVRRLTVEALVFGVHLQRPRGALYLSTVEPVSRRELGVWLVGGPGRAAPRLVIPPPTGWDASALMRRASLRWDPRRGITSEWCAAGSCVTRAERGPTGPLEASSLPPDAVPDAGLPLVTRRPIPGVGGWPVQMVLEYRWHSADPPPGWMRPALKEAAKDAGATSRSRGPVYAYDPDVHDSFRYTEDFPGGGCAQAIACASRSVPDSWTVRLRPQGYDFRWGTLRWCQATDSDEGCFDVERAVLHELGHVGGGFQHPEDAGYRMRALDTVMHAVIPVRPRSGSGMHAYGPCDVATFQELYGLPSLDTHIPVCEELETKMSLGASTSVAEDGDTVVFTATLGTESHASYGQLGGIRLNDRSVQLRRRLKALAGAWHTYWMSPSDSPGTYVLSLRPGDTYEYQALYKTPDDEGLVGSSSNILTVRLSSDCSGSACGGGGAY